MYIKNRNSAAAREGTVMAMTMGATDLLAVIVTMHSA